MRLALQEIELLAVGDHGLTIERADLGACSIRYTARERAQGVELGGKLAREETRSRVFPPGEVETGVVLNAAVILKDPKKITLSLKRSSERSIRLKSDPYRSAMSMLTFYINRAGKHLSDADRSRLEKAKYELRKLFHREPAKPAR